MTFAVWKHTPDAARRALAAVGAARLAAPAFFVK
jgi:hypothetical protein